MQAYILLRGAEQRGHLSLAKPHRIPVEANLLGNVFVLRLKYHNRASHNSSPPVDSKNAWLFIQRSSAQTANPPSLIFPHLEGSACEPPFLFFSMAISPRPSTFRTRVSAKPPCRQLSNKAKQKTSSPLLPLRAVLGFRGSLRGAPPGLVGAVPCIRYHKTRHIAK